MELEEKESYVTPAILVVEVKAGYSVCVLSDPNGQGNGFEGWD